jgi:hypothetical protein
MTTKEQQEKRCRKFMKKSPKLPITSIRLAPIAAASFYFLLQKVKDIANSGK